MDEFYAMNTWMSNHIDIIVEPRFIISGSPFHEAGAVFSYMQTVVEVNIA